MVIFYDIFSHFFKIKKVANCQIVQIKVVGSLVYLLTLEERFIVMDLVKMEELQTISVRNDSKLHEKVKHFEINKKLVYFYGT